MASLPDDPAAATMPFDTDAYWEPYRSMRDSLQHGLTPIAAGTLEAYARAAAGRGAEQPRNVLVMLGDDAPMQTPWVPMYDSLDKVLAHLNAKADATNITCVPARLCACVIRICCWQSGRAWSICFGIIVPNAW